MHFTVFIACLTCWRIVSTFKILIVLPAPWFSHHQFGNVIAKALAADGSEVTVISRFKNPHPTSNYEELFIDFDRDEIRCRDREIFEAFQKKFVILDVIRPMTALRESVYNSIVESDSFQKLLASNRKFDAIIVESSWLNEIHGLSYHFNAPIIAISSTWEASEFDGLTAMPNLKSFIPTILNSFTDRMSFWERLNNQATNLFLTALQHTFGKTAELRAYETFFSSNNLPSIHELQRNISLFLINSHSTLESSRPLMPNIITVGGLPILANDTQTVADDVRCFLDDAKSGAVLFSYGSAFEPTMLPPEILQSILETFRELREVEFLVKGDDQFGSLCQDIPNVLVRSWLPQKAILHHPNMKCFIYNGGHNGIQETIYYGKPVIVIPCIADNFINARWAEEKGYGIELQQSQITLATMRTAIENILNNSSYTFQAQIASERFRDRVAPPLETAVFWIKYVAATKGAFHLRSQAAHYSWFVYYNLDVWLFFLTTSSLGTFLLLRIFSNITYFTNPSIYLK